MKVQLMSAQHNDHPTHQNILSDDAGGKCQIYTHTHGWSCDQSHAVCGGYLHGFGHSSTSKDQTAADPIISSLRIQQRSDS